MIQWYNWQIIDTDVCYVSLHFIWICYYFDFAWYMCRTQAEYERIWRTTVQTWNKKDVQYTTRIFINVHYINMLTGSRWNNQHTPYGIISVACVSCVKQKQRTGEKTHNKSLINIGLSSLYWKWCIGTSEESPFHCHEFSNSRLQLVPKEYYAFEKLESVCMCSFEGVLFFYSKLT